jgi:hypothetical protein
VKTISLKKVSAVAVASLGFGLLSVVPAQADPGTATSIAVAKTTESPSGTPLAVGKFTAAPVLDANQVSSITVTAGATVKLLVTAIGGTFTAADDIKVAMRGFGTIDDWDAADATDAGAESNNSTFTATSVPGTYTLDVTLRKDGVSDVTTDLTASITMVVSAASGYSNQLSTAFMRSVVADTVGATPDATSDAAGVSAPAAKGGSTGDTENAADINVLIKNSSNAAMASGNTMAAEITGPGYLFWENGAVGKDKCLVDPTFGAATGRSLSGLAIDADTYLYVCADGTPGVASIKITITDAAGTSYVLATKTVTFFGSVTKIAATGVLTVAAAGGATLGDPTASRDTAAKTPAIIVKATDSANNPVSNLTFTYKSSDVTVMVETLTCAEDIKSTANAFSSGGKGFYNCRVTSSSGAKSGNKATLTVRTVDPAGDGTTFLTSDVAFTIGGSATTGTETIAFDKTSYAPGEAMVITRTAKDSSGNPVADFTASPNYSFSKAVGGATPAAGVYVGGVSKTSTSAATSGIFAPVSPGSFIVTATAANGATITATATVTDANAGLLTQIDALNAKIVALNALIAKIMKKLGVK